MHRITNDVGALRVDLQDAVEIRHLSIILHTEGLLLNLERLAQLHMQLLESLPVTCAEEIIDVHDYDNVLLQVVVDSGLEDTLVVSEKIQG